MDYQLLKHASERKAHQRVLFAESSRIAVTATNFGEQVPCDDFNYVVCVLDDNECTGAVYDAEFMVSGRTVKAIEAARTEKATEEISRGPTPVDYRAAKALLGETFGTRKAKQALNSLTKNQINIDQLESNAASFINRNLDKSLDRMASAAEADAAGGMISGQVMQDSMGILPPFNSTTSKVEQIYQIKSIIPESIWNSLSVSDFSTSSNEPWEALQQRYQMCDYVLDRIRNMLDEGGSGISEERLKSLLYLHLLFKLKEAKEGLLNNEAGLQKAFPEASPAVINHLLETFTESLTINGKIKRKLSSLSKDRLLSHLCILTLLVEEPKTFRVNLTLLSTILKIPVTKMTDYFKAVGCAIEKPGKGEDANYTAPGTTRALQVKFALLKAPITFPKPKRGPQK